MPRTDPARGMRDYLPEDVRQRQHVIDVIARVYERYGFEPLETPAVENIDTLMGKYGEEGNRLIYKILKRGEKAAAGEADLALRYDLTVPLARVIAHHRSRLPRLFKRYQIQPVWRADRPGRGRYREFYQCDVDSLGSRSPVIEAELCAAVADVLEGLGFSDFVIRLNHRQLLTAILGSAGVAPPLHEEAMIALDKRDRIGADGVAGELERRGIEAAVAKALLSMFAATDADDALDRIEPQLDTGADGRAAVENLRAIRRLASGTSAGARIRVDLTLARGLSYYTGAIMEINVPDLAGSLGGGGRYDDLVGMFLGEQVPACGFSLGLERILVVMSERGMFPQTLALAPADVLIANFDRLSEGAILQLAARLRDEGLRVLVYPDAEKLGKQIKYADARKIPCVAIVGEDEIRDGTVTVKNLGTQTQATHAQADAGAAILEVVGGRG